MRPDSRHGASLQVVPPPRDEAPSDAALAVALQRGDEGAPGRAWGRFAPLVYGALARALGPGHEIEDLTQEVFLRLFRKIRTLEDPGALRSFVYSIAIRVMRAELRRRWVRRIMRPSDPRDLPEPGAGAPPDEGGLALARLYAILDQLKAKERTVFVLRHIEGLTLEETAQAARVSLATAKRWLAHACARVDHHARRDPFLQHYLDGRPDGEGP